jgi:hypothetical protein
MKGETRAAIEAYANGDRSTDTLRIVLNLDRDLAATKILIHQLGFDPVQRFNECKKELMRLREYSKAGAIISARAQLASRGILNICLDRAKNYPDIMDTDQHEKLIQELIDDTLYWENAY